MSRFFAALCAIVVVFAAGVAVANSYNPPSGTWYFNWNNNGNGDWELGRAEFHESQRYDGGGALDQGDAHFDPAVARR